MNKNYFLYINKILIFIFILFICSCSSKINNSNNFNNVSIEILSDIPGIGDKIKNHYIITAHYKGFLEDGTEFDNSYKRDKPIKFQIGLMQVIPAWEIGIIGMQAKGKRKIKATSSLAYGKKGIKNLIPPNSTLIFEIEILNIEKHKYRFISQDVLINLKKEKLLNFRNEKFILIDIRNQKDFFNTGIIKDSYKIEAFDLKGNLNSNFIKDLNSLSNKEDHIILISEKGEISSILANGLVENIGMKNVYSLKGGIQQWINEGNQILK